MLPFNLDKEYFNLKFNISQLVGGIARLYRFVYWLAMPSVSETMNNFVLILEFRRAKEF